MGRFEFTDYKGFVGRLLQPKYMREVAENLEGLRAPIHIEPNMIADKLIEKIIPQHVQRKLIEGSTHFEIGAMYEHNEIVGRKSDGRVHPHEFMARKIDDNTLELFFVDPEHNIGKDSQFIPAVSNMMSARIYVDGRDPEFAILRHKTERVVAEHPLKGLVVKLSHQSRAAQQLLGRDGIPEYLNDFQDQILFRLVIKRERASDRRPRFGLVQSIFSTPRELSQLLDENLKPNGALEHKLDVEQIIFERFAEYMQNGMFAKVDQIVKKRIGLSPE